MTTQSSRKATKRNTVHSGGVHRNHILFTSGRHSYPQIPTACQIRHKEETLFSKESQHHYHEPFGISTVTWFEGTSNVAYEEVYSHIRERLRLVLQANPWVAGKIIPGKSGHKV